MFQRITHQTFLHREGLTRGMHSISTPSVLTRCKLCEGPILENQAPLLEEDQSQIYGTQNDAALCGKFPQEINNIVHKVNDAGRTRLL